MGSRLAEDQAALLDFAVSHSPVVFFASDPADDFRITFISDNIERLSGHSAKDIMADPGYTRRHIHADDLAELERALSAVSPETPMECEYRIRGANGDYVWFREEIRMVDDVDGRRVVGCMIDVTDRHEAERERQRLAALVHDAIDSMPNGFVVYDPDDRVVLCNKASARLFSSEPEDLVGRHASEMIERAIDATQSIDGRIIEDRAAKVDEIYARHRAADGHELEIEREDGRCMVICVQPTSEGGTVVTRTDITERKAAERALAHTAAQYRTVLDNTPSSIVKLDHEGRYVYVNPAYCARIGQSSENVIGRTIAEVVGQENADLVSGYFERALAGERVRWQGWATYAVTGRRYVQRDYQPDTDAEGKVVGMIAFTHDLTELKEAQSSLEEREARFRAIAEAVPLPILIVASGAGEILFANELATHGLGVDVGDSGRLLEQSIIDDAARRAQLAKLSATGSLGFEVQTRGPDGIPRWELLFASFMTYDGRPAILLTSIDITDRKEAEHALRESEARFRDFADSASDWFWETDESFRLTWFSTETHPVTGEPTSNTLGRSLMNNPSYHPGDAGLDALIETVKAKRPFNNLHVRLDAPDGTVRDLNLAAVPYFDGAGYFKGYRGSTSDITDRKRAEEALRASEAQTRTILDNIPARVVLSDPERRLIYVNRRYREYRRATDEGGLGRTTAEVLGSENSAILKPFADRALAGDSIEWHGWINDPINGEEFQQRVYQPYRGASGGIEGYLTFVRDLTEQKRTEHELAKQRELVHQNEKLAALGSLLAGVAHELNNPLSVVVGRSIMLAEEVEDPAIARSVGRIRDAAERCARIVKTFLAMARQQTPSMSSVSLNDLVRASLEMVEYILRTTDIEIAVSLAPDLPMIDADGDRISQVLVNLCINAGQAMEGMSQRRLSITTGLDESGERITVDVTDTGCGISPENLSRIFDPFYTTKPLGVGTGVGLSISHAIVTAHGGTIDVKSEVGRGTTFHLAFPVAAKQTTEDQSAAPGLSAATSAILIVDDEVEIAEMLSELLGKRGHRVEIAHSGREALARLEQTEFDLVVSDLKMPDIGGRELYRLVEADRPSLRDRFLFITGDTLGADITEFIRDAGLVCLEKPMLPTDVLAAVSRVLDVVED